jgi:hypothetical protein
MELQHLGVIFQIKTEEYFMVKKGNCKFKFGKNAQAGIIVAVVLILVAIIAIIVLWNIFNPLIKDKTKDINIDPLKTNIQIKGVSLFVTGSSQVKIERGSDNNKIDSLVFIFYDEKGNAYSENVSENLPNFLESKNYFFSPIPNFGKINKVSVYPVIGGKVGIESRLDSSKILNVPLGLVSWFSLSEDLKDSVGINNGVSYGDVSFGEHNLKKSAYFNSGTVDFGNDPSLNLENEFAISFWITTGSKSGLVLEKGIVNPNYKIEINNDGTLNFSYSSSGTIKSFKSSNDISDGNWHNVVVTNMAVYLDGHSDTIIGTNDQLDSNNLDLIVGEGLNGSLKDVMIFNKSLDIGQAESIFNLQL